MVTLTFILCQITPENFIFFTMYGLQHHLYRHQATPKSPDSDNSLNGSDTYLHALYCDDISREAEDRHKSTLYDYNRHNFQFASQRVRRHTYNESKIVYGDWNKTVPTVLEKNLGGKSRRHSTNGTGGEAKTPSPTNDGCYRYGSRRHSTNDGKISPERRLSNDSGVYSMRRPSNESTVSASGLRRSSYEYSGLRRNSNDSSCGSPHLYDIHENYFDSGSDSPNQSFTSRQSPGLDDLTISSFRRNKVLQEQSAFAQRLAAEDNSLSASPKSRNGNNHHHHSIQELVRHFGKKVRIFKSLGCKSPEQNPERNIAGSLGGTSPLNESAHGEFRSRSKSLDVDYGRRLLTDDCDTTYKIYESILQEGIG